jgi:hypothetical protein
MWIYTSLFVQSLTTFLATPIGMLQAGLGPMNGCSHPILANWAAFSLSTVPSQPNTHISDYEEHILWNRKLHKDHRATVMDILSENSKKEYPNSIIDLLRLDERRFVQGACYFINKIPKLI